MKIVITGGPCSGKTTLIRYLERQGYKVLHEVPRQIIREYKQKGIDHSQKRNEFQFNVLKRTIERNKKIKDGEIVFLDVDIPEGIAYFKANGEEPPNWLLKAAKEHAKYHKVILLEQIPFHRKDDIRIEDAKTALKISKIIEELYNELGYEVHKIPFMHVKKRAEIIKKICNIK